MIRRASKTVRFFVCDGISQLVAGRNHRQSPTTSSSLRVKSSADLKQQQQQRNEHRINSHPVAKTTASFPTTNIGTKLVDAVDPKHNIRKDEIPSDLFIRNSNVLPT